MSILIFFLISIYSSVRNTRRFLFKTENVKIYFISIPSRFKRGLNSSDEEETNERRAYESRAKRSQGSHLIRSNTRYPNGNTPNHRQDINIEANSALSGDEDELSQLDARSMIVNLDSSVIVDSIPQPTSQSLPQLSQTSQSLK